MDDTTAPCALPFIYPRSLIDLDEEQCGNAVSVVKIDCLVVTTLFPLIDSRRNRPVTLFSFSLPLDRTQKQRFLHLSIWSDARNAVSDISRQGKKQSSRHKPFAQIALTLLTLFLTTVCEKLTRQHRLYWPQHRRASSHHRQTQGQSLQSDGNVGGGRKILPIINLVLKLKEAFNPFHPVHVGLSRRIGHRKSQQADGMCGRKGCRLDQPLG